MKPQEQDFNLFAQFGEPEITEIDLTRAPEASNENEPAPTEQATQEARAGDKIEVRAEDNTPKLNTGFSWAAFTGGLAAFVWVGGAVGGPIAYFGWDAVLAMDPTLQAALIALALGPAMLFWLGGAAAGEAFKARKLALEISKMARTAFNPFESNEGNAKRLSAAVKTEIDALNDAVTTALARLSDFQSAAERNAAMFDDAVAVSREHADHLAGNLARERDAIVELNGELRGQTETMAHSIGRQVRLMREASKLVRSELGAAEDALENHLKGFAASAHTMSERTAAMHNAAENAHAANGSLNLTLNGMLDSLGQATHMTDAARQSAEEAKLAAHETASAVRETAQRAVMDAKRAAQMIRAESDALQEAAGETLSRLQAAADAARAASNESQAAADRHAASIEKRLTALAQTAAVAKKPAQPVRAPVEAPARQEPPRSPTWARLDAVESAELHAAASVQSERPAERPQREAKRYNSWGNLFASPRREEPVVEDKFEDDSLELMQFCAPARDPDADLKDRTLDLIAAAGVDIDAVLTSSDLEQVAQASRQGPSARRQTVVDVAPVAINRIMRYLKRNPDAVATAEEFRARPDLAKSEKKGQASEMVRAYLLVDTALD